MNGSIQLNGWSFVGSQKLKKGLVSGKYRNAEGWTAEDTFAGPKDKFIGLLIKDEKGKAIGIAPDVSQLP